MTFSKKLMIGGVPAMGLISLPFLLKSESNGETVKPIENSGVKEDEDEELDGEELDVGLIENDNKDDQFLLSLLRQAGLKCRGVDDGSACQIGTKKKGVEISRDSTKDSDLYFSSGGKLVIHKISGKNYKNSIRFTVEGGDIVLKKNNGNSLTLQKLERFESYGLEIEGQEKNKKLYLVRKQTSQEGIMRTLGLPTNCTLPANSGESTKCPLNFHNQIKNVHFVGRKKGGAAAIVTNDLSTKKVNLTIEKTSEIPPFNEGYKFTFTPDVDVEISSGNTIKKDQGTDFRIIEWKDKNMSLERAWKDSDLIGKAGLECANGYCTIKNGSLNVMQDNKTLTNAHATINGAKIKLHKNQNHYENGIKLVIEDGDITLTGSGDGSVSKLSRYEGYEIVNKDNVYYLNRRHLDIVEIVKLLGEPCNIAGSKNPFNNNNTEIRCSTLLTENFKKIKFDGIQSEGIVVTNSTSLSIEKTSETSTFKYGYKFKFTPDEEITISPDNKLRKKFATYFKIKGEGESISLERAVKPNDLIEKVGLQCSGDAGSETCTFKEGRKINVTLGHLILTNSTPSSGHGVGSLKLVDRNNKDYNEGLKFEVVGGDITFTGDDGNKARMGEFDTYEIKETGGKWHLHQKSNFMQNKHNAVGIPAKCKNSFSSDCDIGWEAKGLNFKEKKSETVKAMFSSGASLRLKLHRESMYKYGIKVSIKAVGGGNPTLSLACEAYDPNVLFKITKEEMEFEIEKDSNDSNRFVLVKRGGTTPLGLATDCKPPQRDE